MSTTRGARRDFAALEARRFQAARLFGRGASQGRVARELGVTRTTAHRWYHAWQTEGRRGLNAVGRAGRKPRLDRQQLARVEAALLKGPADRGGHRPRDRGAVSPGTCLAHPAGVELVVATARPPGAGAGRGGHWTVATPALAAGKKTRGAGTPG